jgi:predicted glutamine amidotransferase
MKELFQSLLFHDVTRGDHATGVAAIDTMTREVVVVKKAIPSPLFLQDKELMDPLFNVKHNFNVYIGHNRWATKGAKDDDNNAHPFQHGHITGVHNGSLRNQNLLTDAKNFAVDSDNLYYHMSQDGLDETIKKTDGAYSLVWYDAQTNELNLLRNNERPMAVAKLTNGYYVLASEIGLIRWLVGRSKNLQFAKYKDGDTEYDHIYNTAVMAHLRLPFTDKTRNMEGPFRVSKKEEPTFPVISRYSGYGGNWDNYENYSSTVTRGTDYVPQWKKDSWKWFQQIIPTAKKVEEMDDINVEVKFLGNIQEKSRSNSNYSPRISLFEYKNAKGFTFILHSFCHGTGLTNDWGDEKVGTMLYGRLGAFTAKGPVSYESIQNESHEGDFQVSLISVSERRPNRVFLYMANAVKQEATADNSVVEFRGKPVEEATSEASKDGQKVICVDSKGVASGNVRELRPALGSRSGNTSQTRDAGLIEGESPEEFMKKKVTLANLQTTQGNLIDMLSEGGGKCSNCAAQMWSIPVGSVFVHQHYDHDLGKTIDYLTCGKKCHDVMVEITNIMDEDFARSYGKGGSDEL